MASLLMAMVMVIGCCFTLTEASRGAGAKTDQKAIHKPTEGASEPKEATKKAIARLKVLLQRMEALYDEGAPLYAQLQVHEDARTLVALHRIQKELLDVQSEIASVYFRAKGWSPRQADIIIAALTLETRLDPDTQDEKGIGIAHWKPELLKAYATEQDMDWRLLVLQLSFLQHQLETVEPRLVAQFMEAETPQEAATAFGRFLRTQHVEVSTNINPLRSLNPLGDSHPHFVLAPDVGREPHSRRLSTYEPPMDFWEDVWNGFTKDNIIANSLRNKWTLLQDQSSADYDPNYVVPEKKRAFLDKNYTEKQREYIYSARSDDTLRSLIDDMNASRYRERRRAKSDWTAAAGLILGQTIALGGIPLVLLLTFIYRRRVHKLGVAEITGVKEPQNEGL